MTVEIFLLVPVPFVPLRIKERCSLRQHLTNLTIFFCTMISRDFVVMIFWRKTQLSWRNCTEWSRFSVVELTEQFYDAIRKSKHSAILKNKTQNVSTKILILLKSLKLWTLACILYLVHQDWYTMHREPYLTRTTYQINVFPGSKLETLNSVTKIR